MMSAAHHEQQVWSGSGPLIFQGDVLLGAESFRFVCSVLNEFTRESFFKSSWK